MPKATKRGTNTRASKSPTPKRKKVADEEENDFNDWTVIDLRAFLKKHNQPTSGVKATLIRRATRLQEINEESSDESESEETGEKEECKYGPKCYRTNSDHLNQFSHPWKKKVEDSNDDDDDENDSEEEEEEEEKKPVSTRAQRAAKAKEEDEEDSTPAANLHGKWITHNNLIYCNPPASPQSNKIAAFDMDSTLVQVKSGAKHSTGRNDWLWLYEDVPKKLHELYKEGYKVVIFSNQGGIPKQTKAGDITGKIDDLMKSSKTPIAAFLAIGKDHFRKPATGMFDWLETEILKQKVDTANSFYVGDAAGRADGWKKGVKKDFSCADRKFGLNCGLKFYTPEEYFLQESPAPFDWRSIDPSTIPDKGKLTDKMNLTSDEQEMIIMVGFPASGKSTFSKNHLVPSGYVHINRDTHKTKCEAMAKAALAEGKSVVIDNTNPSADARSKFIKLAKAAGVPVRCYHMQTTFEQAKHMNDVRTSLTNGETYVSGIAFNMFKKNFQAPALSEGFTEIKKINLVRSHPDKAHEKKFLQWTEVSR